MNERTDPNLYQAIVEKAGEGRTIALATIVATKGSVPRGIGAKMLIDPGEELVGTVGGGCGEGEVIDAAHEVIRTGTPQMVRVDLTDDLLSLSPAVCGGTMEIFVEAVGFER
ncbi:MAG: XdhC family protein [Gemmatimonadota bacterium]|uniref:XdhC- CoxI domain-containing protein n=1 Tax=marine metagenome TaxID=408172 RepID=A0A381XGN0_9ZZZZ|nr:XdhC family protein [Gemmatimonadota bacterium]